MCACARNRKTIHAHSRILMHTQSQFTSKYYTLDSYERWQGGRGRDAQGAIGGGLNVLLCAGLFAIERNLYIYYCSVTDWRLTLAADAITRTLNLKRTEIYKIIGDQERIKITHTMLFVCDCLFCGVANKLGTNMAAMLNEFHSDRLVDLLTLTVSQILACSTRLC